MPTIVNGAPLTKIVLPIAFGRCAKRRVQNPWPITALCACSFSSAIVKPRPLCMRTPRPEKKLPLTMSAHTFSASLPTRTAVWLVPSGT